MSKRPRSDSVTDDEKHHKASRTTTDGKPKRVSRFGDAVHKPPPVNFIDNDAIAAIKAQVEARASQIAQSLHSNSIATHTAAQMASSGARENVMNLQAQVAAQLASVSSILQENNKLPEKTVYKALRLDSQGREIDEHGNLVVTAPVKTLAANLVPPDVRKERAKASNQPPKIDNPYLAHLNPTAKDKGSEGDVSGVDERLASVAKNRSSHLKKALNFVEQGVYTREEEKLKLKEERKIIAGYTSGRKNLERDACTNADTIDGDSDAEETMDGALKAKTTTVLPPPIDGGTVPVMEWWDEVYLTKDKEQAMVAKKKLGALAIERASATTNLTGGSAAEESCSVGTFQPRVAVVAAKTTSGAHQGDSESSATLTATTSSSANTIASAKTIDEFWKMLSLINAKTYRYIHHPVPPKPLGGEVTEDAPLPVYLTTKERKRIRKQAREEREQEKRDRMMMGLIPAPEPKFKLSNFMKVLGDQAVADPSKIEQKVIQQMRKRELNHEMRNQAKKLTPQERKEKERKKNMEEDTSREVHVVVYKVKDLTDRKKQFKVDVTAQQHNLSGMVLLCTNPAIATSVVVAEGGPNGIKTFNKLMNRRIQWKIPSEAYTTSKASAYGSNSNEMESAIDSIPGIPVEESHMDEPIETLEESTVAPAASGPGITEPLINAADNECYLLWQGVLPKRIFHGFRFVGFSSESSGRKILEAKHVEHYWDLAINQKGVSTALHKDASGGAEFSDDDW